MTKRKKISINVPIKPLELTGFSEPKTIPIADLKPGIKKSIEFKKSIIAFVDVLGFANKNNDEEIMGTVADFSAPLALASLEKDNLRFNIFSDNAFIIAKASDSKDLISTLRFAFTQWSSDGILVRGGLAMGSYAEYESVAVNMTKSNFRGNLFSGTAINQAVKFEGSKSGAFLFTDQECATFLHEKFNETILNIDGTPAIAWSDSKKTLFWYTGVSTIRLTKLLSAKNIENESIIKKLVNNILYSLVQEKTGFVASVVLSCLSVPNVKLKIKKKACSLIGINFPSDFEFYDELIKTWHGNDDFKFLQAIAEMDSSLSKYRRKKK